jgi:hypothetical protein
MIRLVSYPGFIVIANLIRYLVPSYRTSTIRAIQGSVFCLSLKVPELLISDPITALFIRTFITTHYILERWGLGLGVAPSNGVVRCPPFG